MKKVFFLILMGLFISSCSDSNNKESSKGSEVTPKVINDSSINKDDPSPSVDKDLHPTVVPNFDRMDKIGGNDNNNDGIRDDIETFIDTQPITKEAKLALRFYGHTIQQALLVDLGDADSVHRVGEAIGRSVGCVMKSFSDREKESYYMDVIEAQMANTKERVKRYIDFNVASSGSVFSIAQGEDCETH